MPPPRLTNIAHVFLRDALVSGGFAIDATAGNGHDTLFLARAVGPVGTVWAFDGQRTAITKTGLRLAEAGLRACLIERMHADLPAYLHTRVQRPADAAMANLGYLPGGDKNFTTRATTTIPVLDALVRALRPGGRLTVIAYPGHPGGAEEATAVENWCHQPDSGRIIHARQASPHGGPVLHCVEKTC